MSYWEIAYMMGWLSKEQLKKLVPTEVSLDEYKKITGEEFVPSIELK